MNPDYFGDSYDIVKRFFCLELRELGYAVSIDGMFTGDWGGTEKAFLHFVAPAGSTVAEKTGRSALFIDPDTGVRRHSSPKHISLERVGSLCAQHDLVFVFDQSFARGCDVVAVMREKLYALVEFQCRGMYYKSHASFLFASKSSDALAQLHRHLSALGMPPGRLIGPD